MALNVLVMEDCEATQSGGALIFGSRLSRSQANVASNTLLPTDAFSQTNDGSVAMVVQTLCPAIRGRSFELFNANGQIFQHVTAGSDLISWGNRPLGTHIVSSQANSLAGIYCHKDGIWSVRYSEGNVAVG